MSFHRWEEFLQGSTSNYPSVLGVLGSGPGECQSSLLSAELLIGKRGEAAGSKKDMEGTTSLWWDMESCPLPFYFDPYVVVSMPPALLRNFNISSSMVNAGEGCSPFNHHHFSAYEFGKDTQTELQQTLINCGIELHQLPPGKNNEMEKMMMADVLLWAMDTPPPANIIFIVGNVDFSYVFQKLLQKSYNVYLVCRSMSEIPQGMLGVVNGCLGWLSFLRSLQNDDQQSHNSGGISVYDDTLSNTAIRTSSTSIHSIEMQESSSASGFNYSQENLSSLKPFSIVDGWNRTCSLPPTPNYSQENLSSLKPSSIVDGWNSTCSLPPTPSDEWDSTCNFPSTLNDGWETPCNFPLDERARSPAQPEPRFHGHSIRTKKPRSPVSSASSTEVKKRASLKEFKEWLTVVVNGKKHAEEGYNISPIRVDFEKATGKILDEKFLGFPKIINLVEDCKDIAMIKEVRRGCHLAFPVKPNEQKNPMPLPGGWNSNLKNKFNSRDKPRAEANPNPKPKRKASAEDFRKFMYHMLQAGEFSQGFLMARLPKRFEQQTGKFLDVEHLGYKRMSELVASYSDLVSVGCVGPGPVRIFPSGFVNEQVHNLYPNSNTIKVTSINMDSNPSNLKAKVEADRPLSGGSGKELIENSGWEENISYEQSPYMNYENQWQPMTFGCFNPREANITAFQEYSIKSDSSSPPGGSQVSEWEGHSSNAIGETTPFHGELEGSDSIKQHVSTLQWESNDPIEDSVSAERLMAEAIQNMTLMKGNISICEEPCIPVPSDSIKQHESVSAERLMAEAIQNMTLMKGKISICEEPCIPVPSDSIKQHVSTLQWESNDLIEDSVSAKRLMAEAIQNMSLMKGNISICEEPCIPAGTGLPGSTPPPSESLSSEPQTGGCNSPLAPLQLREESFPLCADDLRQGIRLDCKQNKQNTSGAGDEEKTVSAVSSAGSIIQVAGRGLKSICELKMWRKN